MKFIFLPLAILAYSAQRSSAQIDKCCVIGGPDSCEKITQNPLELGTFVKGNFVPPGAVNVVDTIPLGHGPVCCCLKQGDGPDACDYCVSYFLRCRRYQANHGVVDKVATPLNSTSQ